MTTRDQLTHERVAALLTELGEAEIIPEEEADGLRRTRGIGEADEVRQSTPGAKALTRSKISQGSRNEFRDARDEGDMQRQLDLLFEILTGEEP